MPAGAPHFRTAGCADVDAVVQLVESAYRGDSSRRGWTTEADLLDGQRTDREEVLSVTRDRHARLLLAVPPLDPGGARGSTGHASELLGCVLVRAEATAIGVDSAHVHLPVVVAHIGMFAVQPALQSRGVGSALLARAERLAREELGASRAEMTVIEQRLDLLPWYERRGYQRTGASEPFPYDNPRFGLPRRADLRFLVLAKALADVCAEPSAHSRP